MVNHHQVEISSNEITQNQHLIFSKYLNREIVFELILPPQIKQNSSENHVLYLNDGQDLKELRLLETLKLLYDQNAIQPLIIVAIHANKDRLLEYGISSIPDYKNRGNRANNHKNFVLHELRPFLNSLLKIQQQPSTTYFAGFSLGGLSAMDIGFKNSKYFSKIGVFSGSFWWRSKALTDPSFDEKKDRIMHRIVANSKPDLNQKFWFECGTKDEKIDRNNNGIIDSIDDTKDIITCLLTKGYTHSSINYVEVKNGTHNFKTWAEVFPEFLKWLVGN